MDASKLKGKSAEYLRLQSEILNHITAGIFLSTVDGTIIYTNPKCEKMFGYSSGEMIGKNTAMLYAPTDVNTGPTREDIRNFVKRDGVWHGEVSRIKKDGSLFWSYSNVTMMEHPAYGEVYVIVHTDISDLKIPPGSEKKDEEKYRSLFMFSRDAVMTLEPPSWTFTSGNPAAIKMFNVKNEAEFLSYEPWKLSPKTQPDGRPSDEKAKEMIAKAMEDGFNVFEWKHKRIGGEEFFAEVLLSKVEQDGEVFLFASVRDITERKKIQDALERLNKQMVGREMKMLELKKEINRLQNIK